MLNKTDAQLMNHSDIASEEHSEQYQQSNKRMYNFKINQLIPFKNPLIPNYSFSNGKSSYSTGVIEIEYRDVNNAKLGKENVLINLDTGSELGITEAEKNLNQEITYDLQNTSKLPLDKAQVLVLSKKDFIKKLVVQKIEEYNSEHEFFEKNTKSLNNTTSRVAAAKLKESAQKNTALVMQKLKSVNIEPSQLGAIVKYIETIDKDDGDLFEIVEEISKNPDVFWINIRDYIPYFDPETINKAEKVGNNIKKVDTRKADSDNTKYNVLVANIVVSDI